MNLLPPPRYVLEPGWSGSETSSSLSWRMTHESPVFFCWPASPWSLCVHNGRVGERRVEERRSAAAAWQGANCSNSAILAAHRNLEQQVTSWIYLLSFGMHSTCTLFYPYLNPFQYFFSRYAYGTTSRTFTRALQTRRHWHACQSWRDAIS